MPKSFFLFSSAERAIRQRITELKGLIATAESMSVKDVQAESLLIARLKDDLLESRRACKGEEKFVKELETVREEGRIRIMEEEEVKMIKERDR